MFSRYVVRVGPHSSMCADVGCAWVTTHVMFSQWLALRVTTCSLGEYSYAYIIVDRITEQYVALNNI